VKIAKCVVKLCVLAPLLVGFLANPTISAEQPCEQVKDIRYDSDVPAKPDRAWQPNKDAQDWIIDRITHPNNVLPEEAPEGVLDLALRDPLPHGPPTLTKRLKSDRVVSAKFLEDLLTGVTPHAALPHGIRLAHVIVVQGDDKSENGFDLSGADLPYAVKLKGFYFTVPVHLVGARFGQGLDLSDTVFTQPLDASNLTVVGSFIAIRTRFMDTGEESAIFQRLSVAGPLIMRYATFSGNFDITDARIGGVFSLRSASFGPWTTPKWKVDADSFNRTVVAGAFVPREAHFCAPVDARGMIIGGDVEGKESVFNPSTVNRDVSYPLDLESATIEGFVDFHLATIRALTLYNARIRGGLNLNGTKFVGSQERVALNDAQILGVAFLNQTDLTGCLVLTNATFQSLILNPNLRSSASCNDDPGAPPVQALELEGLKYSSITAGAGPDDLKQLLRVFALSPYSASVYADLEAFYKRGGYPDRPDQVFIAGQDRHQKELMSQHKWLQGFWLLLQGQIAGYGRQPYLAISWYGLFILLACAALFWIPPLKFKSLKPVPWALYPRLLIPWTWWSIYKSRAPWQLRSLLFSHDLPDWLCRAYSIAGIFFLILGVILVVSGLYAITGGDIVGPIKHYLGF
jgi:hypothetical protein